MEETSAVLFISNRSPPTGESFFFFIFYISSKRDQTAIKFSICPNNISTANVSPRSLILPLSIPPSLQKIKRIFRILVARRRGKVKIQYLRNRAYFSVERFFYVSPSFQAFRQESRGIWKSIEERVCFDSIRTRRRTTRDYFVKFSPLCLLIFSYSPFARVSFT